jgi:hypothetical protein
MTWENPKRMVINKVAILLGLFIFGITAQLWADSVKSINNAVNQVTIMKMDENKEPRPQGGALKPKFLNSKPRSRNR